MMSKRSTNLTAHTVLGQQQTKQPSGEYVSLLGETYYRIANYDQMSPFFMSVVSSGDHWLFIASTGGLSAGRKNPDAALFPYETEDKLTANHELTGSKVILQVLRNGRDYLWEPFSNRYAGIYHLERNLYKNNFGDKLIFEEVNRDLGLTLRHAWRMSDRYGFAKSGWLQNDDSTPCQIQMVDGFQNLLPYGVTASLQATRSGLLNAYKRSELESETGIGIFALSATLTDRAEPSESLKASVVWQVGLQPECHLLCSEQLDAFRFGRPLTPESDICGKAGSYFVKTSFDLGVDQAKEWHFAADVNQDRVALSRLIGLLKREPAAVVRALEEDIAKGTAALVRYVAAADGLQLSAQTETVVHHYANVLFNIMRGGIFADGYQIKSRDFREFIEIRNRLVLQSREEWFDNLPASLHIRDLYELAAATGDPSLMRLGYEYLPLTFSRRHGDPSRPWNHFSINLKKADGSQNLDYQGNWRDIFQNWEPLALAFPAYTQGIIAKFLNATTADGYNPYRVTRDGIEWEEVEPDNPWSNIGYWSDHQIIYLQKLLEIGEQIQPGLMVQFWNQPIFSYANVPYRQRSYQQMLADWYNTIDYDWESEDATTAAVSRIGTDGRLLLDSGGNVIHVTMVEKLLVLLLAKLTNLVPEGGIWMNTQRPEWNDANNALVGKGLSVVTAAYLRRFISFWRDQLNRYGPGQSFLINSAVATLLTTVQTIFADEQALLASGFTAGDRRRIMDALGTAAEAYRTRIYQSGIPDQQSAISAGDLQAFLTLAQAYVEQTLQVNRRADGLGHTYNIMRLEEGGVVVENLYLMLEGQVGYLSAALLSSEEALNLLRSLRHSELYRPDQHSYMLYPNLSLPGFLQKNNVSAGRVADSQLVAALRTAGDVRLLVQDETGEFHFNGRFRNANDVSGVLNELAREVGYAELVEAERDFILELFEDTFNHSAFTGRSGTFFAYEGLGSIYWHMVSKLLLAAQEAYEWAVAEKADAAVVDALAAAYYDIRAGLGFNKTPEIYGAFPTDPYSHTPLGGGAQQPGMTGMVKEEILTRWGELGVSLQHGILCFRPTLLQENEFLREAADFDYVDISGEAQTMTLAPGSLAFTICQVPVVYRRDGEPQIELLAKDGRTVTVPGDCLDLAATRQILNRDGQIAQIKVTVTL